MAGVSGAGQPDGGVYCRGLHRRPRYSGRFVVPVVLYPWVVVAVVVVGRFYTLASNSIVFLKIPCAYWNTTRIGNR